ncbi:MAG: 6-phosphogluconolactonase [Bryobacterales bacterium]|nr:6-phosphogluconolactonase [Bryobacteraceae bacterium]MDW8354050.1 6-phosphogluconolactonase [Bryobacterales bacterium]
MSFLWHAYPSARAAGEACAEHVAGLLHRAVLERDWATLAVSGGATARLLFEPLARVALPWPRLHLFWVDERAVPPSDPQSNSLLAEETLVAPARIPRGNVHRIHGELAPEAAAQRYEEDIRNFFGLTSGELPRFDVIHCGLGADGHIASLFPGSPLLADRTGIVGVACAARLGQKRVTLLPAVLRNAAHVIFLVTGPDKAEAVRAAIEEAENPDRYPAHLLRGRQVRWFLDEAAARLLRAP